MSAVLIIAILCAMYVGAQLGYHHGRQVERSKQRALKPPRVAEWEVALKHHEAEWKQPLRFFDPRTITVTTVYVERGGERVRVGEVQSATSNYDARLTEIVAVAEERAATLNALLPA